MRCARTSHICCLAHSNSCGALFVCLTHAVCCLCVHAVHIGIVCVRALRACMQHAHTPLPHTGVQCFAHTFFHDCILRGKRPATCLAMQVRICAWCANAAVLSGSQLAGRRVWSGPPLHCHSHAAPGRARLEAGAPQCCVCCNATVLCVLQVEEVCG
jgi:hypothetical protein